MFWLRPQLTLQVAFNERTNRRNDLLSTIMTVIDLHNNLPCGKTLK